MTTPTLLMIGTEMLKKMVGFAELTVIANGLIQILDAMIGSLSSVVFKYDIFQDALINDAGRNFININTEQYTK